MTENVDEWNAQWSGLTQTERDAASEAVSHEWCVEPPESAARDNITEAVSLRCRLQHDLACVTGSLEDAEKTPWIGSGSVVPHLQSAAQSLNVTLLRLDAAAATWFGEDEWRIATEDTR